MTRLTSQAGAAILKESGGFITGGTEAFAQDLPIGDFLMKRRYTCIRAVPPTKVSPRLASSLILTSEQRLRHADDDR